MQPNSELDPFVILDSLGFDRPDAVQPVTGGVDARIWRVEIAGAPYALRVLTPSQANQARCEQVATIAAAAAGLPVPAVIATGTWHDHPVQLLSWMPGAPLAAVLQQAPVSAGRAHALGVAFGAVQAAIHTVPVPDSLDRSARWQDWAGPDPALQRRLAALPGRRTALLHLDYHPLNVLAEHDRITAVLDWANARAGDPRADLARTCAIVQLAPLPPALETVARPLLRAFETGWREGYGTPEGGWEALAPFYWWAGEVMLRDLSPRLGRADLSWLTADYLDRVGLWTAEWRKRAERHSG